MSVGGQGSMMTDVGGESGGMICYGTLNTGKVLGRVCITTPKAQKEIVK